MTELSAECLGWAQAAHYTNAIAEDGDVQLRSEIGAPTRYYIRSRGAARLELTEAVEGEDERPLLFVAELDVLDRHLIGLLGDDIRDDLDLPYLDLPTAEADTADGYRLGPPENGSRTLLSGSEPVAAAPGELSSLAALVPLSHFLGHSLDNLRRSYLDERGTPLLRGGRYAAR